MPYPFITIVSRPRVTAMASDATRPPARIDVAIESAARAIASRLAGAPPRHDWAPARGATAAARRAKAEASRCVRMMCGSGVTWLDQFADVCEQWPPAPGFEMSVAPCETSG